MSKTLKNEVCLLVPCFNAAPYIEDFLKHVKGQTRKFDEILFCDDQSSDNTFEILNHHAPGRVIQTLVNSGPSVARNLLISASHSPLIHFHDVDDWMEPTFLEESLNTLSDTDDAVITNIRVIDRELGHTRHIHDYEALNKSEDPTAFFLTNCCYPINGLYRRNAVVAIGGFREALTRDEDPDFHIRLAHSGAKIVCLPKPLAINRFGLGTYSSNSYSACWREHLKALTFYERELPSCYIPILAEDASGMAYLSAYTGERELSKGYIEFCLRNGSERLLKRTGGKGLQLLMNLFGVKGAYSIRFNPVARAIRSALALIFERLKQT